MFTCEVSGSLECDLSLILHLALVADQIYADVLTRMLADFVEPVGQVRKRLLSRDIVGEEDAMRTAVKDTRHRLEGLLPRGVPDLQLYYFFIYFEPERAEFDTDSNLVLHFEFIVHHSLHETTLAHSCVSNNDQLEQVVLSGERLVCDHLMSQLG